MPWRHCPGAARPTDRLLITRTPHRCIHQPNQPCRYSIRYNNPLSYSSKNDKISHKITQTHHAHPGNLHPNHLPLPNIPPLHLVQHHPPPPSTLLHPLQTLLRLRLFSHSSHLPDYLPTTIAPPPEILVRKHRLQRISPRRTPHRTRILPPRNKQ